MITLTNREYQSYMLCGAAGLTPEEAGDRLNIAANTIKVNLKKVKEKTNWHKISELSASAICEYIGVDYFKIRAEIIESVKVGLIWYAGSRGLKEGIELDKQFNDYKISEN